MQGFVIGKFCPPHLGHAHLIEKALQQVDELTIIVCGKSTQSIPAHLRVRWLQEAYPRARVVLLDQNSFDDTSEVAWTRATQACLGGKTDIMFSSEAYGEHYAKLLQCRHVLVDKERVNVPVSASKIRQDPGKYWQFILPAAREYFRSPSRP